MPKSSSSKYYQVNKERLQKKKLRKIISPSTEEKEKKVTICSSTIQQCTRICKTKAG